MFTLTIPDALEARLKVIAARYNGATGTDLSVPQFVELHLVEMATQEDLEQAVPAIQKARDEGLAAELAAKRVQLIADFRAQMRTPAPAAAGAVPLAVDNPRESGLE